MSFKYYITPDDYKKAKSNGISEKQLYRRVYQENWNIDRAVNTPMRKESNWGDWSNIAQANGIKSNTFYMRVNELGWDAEKAATTKTLDKKEVYKRQINNRKRKIPKKYLEIAEENGIKRSTFYNRVYKLHWGLEKASTTPVIKVNKNHKWRKEYVPKHKDKICNKQMA